MDKKTRIAVAKELLKLAKTVNAAIEWPSPEMAVEEDEGTESARLLKQNPQLNTAARRLNAFGLSISDMFTVVLMAMKLKGAPMAEINRAYSLLKPMLKRIV